MQNRIIRAIKYLKANEMNDKINTGIMPNCPYFIYTLHMWFCCWQKDQTGDRCPVQVLQIISRPTVGWISRSSISPAQIRAPEAKRFQTKRNVPGKR